MGKQESLVLKGINKTLYIEGGLLRFKYGVKDLMFGSKELRGSKEIHLSNITSVQHKKADITGYGFIEFTLNGSQDSVSGRKGARQDENTIVYINPAKNNLAKEIASYISDYTADRYEGKANRNNQNSGDTDESNYQRIPERSTLREEAKAIVFSADESSKNAQLEALKKEFDKGNITEVEFIRMLKHFTD